MSLPQLTSPEFVTEIPSTGKEIKYRPFLVKEEKILLMALEGGDDKEISRAIMNILSSCIIDDVDLNSLATFDIEYLFLKLRAKSVGEVIELVLSHPKKDIECDHKTEVDINIDDIKVIGDISDGKIQINDSIGLKLRYAGLKDIDDLNGTDTDQLYDVVVNCVEYIYDTENVYDDFTKDEMSEWLGQLSTSQFKKITDFFENAPKLSHVVEWTCPKCGKKERIVLEGLQSFFT
jgi:hypothetical protein